MRSWPTLEASEPGTSWPPIEVPRVADDPCGGGGFSPGPARKLHARGFGGNRGHTAWSARERSAGQWIPAGRERGALPGRTVGGSITAGGGRESEGKKTGGAATSLGAAPKHQRQAPPA